jgi:hypothetical protein
VTGTIVDGLDDGDSGRRLSSGKERKVRKVTIARLQTSLVYRHRSSCVSRSDRPDRVDLFDHGDIRRAI